MKHAILILAHNQPEYLKSLVDYFDERFIIYIHLDRKSRLKKKEIARLSENKQVVLVSRKYKINWGGFNLLKAKLFLLEQAMKDERIGYFHMISGQDIPTKSVEEFIAFFEQNKGNEFLENATLPRQEWEEGTFARFEYCYFYNLFDYRSRLGRWILYRLILLQKKYNIRRKIPAQFKQLYGGSEWFSLSRACIKYILDYTRQSPAFLHALKYTFAPEETYFPTIVMNSSFKERVTNNNLRYIVWKNKHNSFPAILDEEDFFKVLSSDGFFARKIDPQISQELIGRIRERQQMKLDVREYGSDISDRGYWERNYYQGHCYDSILAKALCICFQFMEVDTILDLGCGPGWYVKTFREIGFSAEGYDGNPYTKELSSFVLNDGTTCGILDLSKPLSVDISADVVFSLEVAEHIPEEFEDIYISNVVQCAKKYIVLSWAKEGQWGEGHINCRDNEYIVWKFAAYGYVENVFAKNYLRQMTELQWFRETLFVFQKGI